MSNPTDPTRGQTHSPSSPRTAGDALADDPVQRVMLVSGIGVALAVVGLVVTLIVGPGSGEAESDSALPATTTQSSTSAPVPAPAAPVAATSQQYLAELSPVGSTAYTGSITVNGVSYPHAIYEQFSGCSTEVSHTYDLDGEWSRFSSSVGVADGGNTDSTLQFSVIADGKSVFTSGNIGVGTPPKVDIPVAGVEKLTIGFTLLNGSSSSCSQLGNGVWGDPTLTK